MKHIFLFIALSFACVQAILGQGLYFLSTCEHQSLCLPSTACDEGPISIAVGVESSCSTPSVSWQIDLFYDGSIDRTGSGTIANDTVPKGTHFIRFRALDFCGNVKFCSFTFSLEDCTAPFMSCLSSFTVNLDGSDCVQVFDADTYVLALSDNCTATQDIQLGIRRHDGSTTFPVADTVRLGRCDVGNQTMQIWSKDSTGRANSCQTTLVVLDNQEACACDTLTPVVPGYVNLTMDGCVRTPSGSAFAPYDITIQTAQYLQNDTILSEKTASYNSMCYVLHQDSLPEFGNYHFSMNIAYDQSQSLGVNTYDLLLIQKHLLGIEPLKNIYHLLAADVNKSGSVTPSDIIDIRKLILGINQNFQAGSYVFTPRFIDPYDLSNFSLSQAIQRPAISIQATGNPISWSIPEFVAVKVGDISGNQLDSLQSSDNRAKQTFSLFLEKNIAKNGDWQLWDLALPQIKDIEALQFSLGFDADFAEIRLEEAPNDGVFYHVFDNEIRFSMLTKNSKLAPIKIWIRAKTPQAANQPFSLATKALKAEAYGKKNYDLALEYSQKTTRPAARLWPNPALLGETLWLQNVPISDYTNLQIFRTDGRLVESLKMTAALDEATLSIPTTNLIAGQLYFLKIQNGTNCETLRFFVK